MMKDVYDYLFKYLEEEYKKTHRDFEYIEWYKCPMCHSRIFKNGTCQHCGFERNLLNTITEKINNSLTDVLKLIKKLGIKNLESNSPYFQRLYSFLDSPQQILDKTIIEEILTEVNYENFFIDHLRMKIDQTEKLSDYERGLLERLDIKKKSIDSELIEKITLDQELTNHDIKMIEKLMDLGLSKNSDIFFIANYVIRDSLLKKQTFSYKTLEQAFLQVAASFANEESPNSICLIEDTIKSSTGQDCDGIHYHLNSYHCIKILREHLLDLYYTGESYVLEVLFHEINHITLDRNLASKEALPNKDLFRQLMDRILLSSSETYYDDNYCLLIIEMDSRVVGYARRQYYLESLGIKESDQSDIQSLINRELLENEGNLRLIDQEVVDIEFFFNNYIRNNLVALDFYSILNYKYKVNNNIVELKSREELSEDLTILIKKQPKFAAQLTDFYAYLMDELSRYQQYMEEKKENEEITDKKY